MNIVLLNPFYTSSHKQWTDILIKYSKHKITPITLPGRHWKWRMHHAGKYFAYEIATLKSSFDMIICSAAHLQRPYPAIAIEMQKELGTDDRPFVIADPGHALTQVPARDANATGGIERSNKFPNDSFFGNWKSTDDTIVWDAVVAESGKFESSEHRE